MSKTIIGKLLEKIGDFFESIFKSADKAFDKLPENVQKALKTGSGIIEIINENKGLSGSELEILIYTEYPELDHRSLLTSINSILTGFNIPVYVEDTIANGLETVRNHLDETKTKSGKLWAALSSLAAKVVAYSLSPSDTKWSQFELLVEYVYQTFIKKDKPKAVTIMGDPKPPKNTPPTP